MRAVLAACVLLLLAVGPVAADCSLDQAISEIRVGAMKRQADLAKTSMAILHKIEVINNKATIQNKPIINQLSKRDLVEFTELRQRLLSIQVQESFESSLDRDVQFIGKMFQVADAVYGGAQMPPPEKSEYYLPAMYLAGLRQVADEQKWPFVQPIQGGTCSIGFALQEVENARFVKINNASVTEATRTMNGILARKKNGQFSAEDRATLERLNRDIVVPTQREGVFIRDLENLKGLWSAAMLKYEVSKKALANSGGDVNAIVTQLNAIMSKGGQIAVFLGALDKIAEVVPSDHVRMMQQMQSAVQKATPARQ